MMETDSQRSLKRDHDSFEETQFGLEEPYPVPPEYLAKLEAESKTETIQPTFSLPMPPATVNTARSNSSSVLSDLGPTTPSYTSDSGSAPLTSNGTDAFAALNGTAAPPAKKAKLTFAEKEMRRIQKEIRDSEKAAEKAKREADRQAQAEEKARKDAEKEVERKKREAEREEKRLATEAEKAAKEERRKKKEEEKQRRDEEKAKAEEEKRKKARSQKTLGSFFTKPAGASTGGSGRTSLSPAPMGSNPSLAAASPAATPSKSKVEKSAYDKMFPEFFIHSDVKVARANRFERDEETTGAIEKIIDDYLLGDRSPGRQRAYDATELFHLQGPDVLRGRRCMPVREIMAEFSGNASRPIDLTTDSQNSQIKKMGDLLKQVPMKFLHFREDVRPPYRGTYTSRPVNGIHRLARNPLRKDLPNTDYDYDSEAEWVEDEDAEDCNSDGEEEDADGEDGEDMEGFLDDENDESNISKRMVLQGDLEPVSSGLCWENERKKNTNVKMLAYRMEIIVDQKLKSIDPFSTAYWQPPVTTTMDPPRIPLTTLKASNSNLPTSSSGASSKPIKPFFAPASSIPHPPQPATALSKDTKPKKLLPPEEMQRFKEAVEGNNLSKVGLIEVLKKQFPNAKAAAIKGTLEVVAKRVGQREADKRWVIVDGE